MSGGRGPRGGGSRAAGRRRVGADGGEHEGTVVEVHGIRAMVLVHGADRRRVRCRPPRDRTTPVVGDRVRFHEGRHGAVIEAIAPRARSLWRPRERGERLMATHVDRVLIVSAVSPPLRTGLIDRILVATEAAEIPAVLVLNKVDLRETAQVRALLASYEELGYPVVEVSAARGQGLDALRAWVGVGMSVLTGHSGVGKSTLLNALVPGAGLSTERVSDATGRGRHTTSVTTCHEVGAPWPAGALLVDTPGVRAFGLYGLELVAIQRGFRELVPLAAGCRFRDCLHEAEPGCAVRAAAAEGAVSAARLKSYRSLLASVRRGEG